MERALVERKSGGSFTLVWGVSEHGLRYISTGVIKTLRPTRLVVKNYTYLAADRPIMGGQVLSVEALAREGGGSLLKLRQGDYPTGDAHWDWYFQAVEAAWPKVVREALKPFLEK